MIDINELTYRFDTDTHEAIFMVICRIGNLYLIEWLISLKDIDINFQDAFRYTFDKSHLSIAKFLYFHNTNILYNISRNSYHRICISGHFDLAQWLYYIWLRSLENLN